MSHSEAHSLLSASHGLGGAGLPWCCGLLPPPSLACVTFHTDSICFNLGFVSVLVAAWAAGLYITSNPLQTRWLPRRQEGNTYHAGVLSTNCRPP